MFFIFREAGESEVKGHKEEEEKEGGEEEEEEKEKKEGE